MVLGIAFLGASHPNHCWFDLEHLRLSPSGISPTGLDDFPPNPHGFLWLESGHGLFPLLLAFLAHFIDIRMGAGDFLFLASCALVFSVTELLILIQFASATGILAFLLQKKKERLPFVPFLLLAACVIIFGKLLLV